MAARRRSQKQKLVDFITFPVRALTLFHEDRYGLSCLATERFDYVARRVQGYCLDIGCGPGNRFVRDFLDGNGVGLDVYPYEGLTDSNIVPDFLSLPFPDATFDTVTFIANLNHAPRSQRDAELQEAFRVLKPGGNIIITMGNFLAEILVHKLVALYDRVFGTALDIDGQRGMNVEEDYYLRPREIRQRLRRAGFIKISREFFLTQWCLNSLFIGWKPHQSESRAL